MLAAALTMWPKLGRPGPAARNVRVLRARRQSLRAVGAVRDVDRVARLRSVVGGLEAATRLAVGVAARRHGSPARAATRIDPEICRARGRRRLGLWTGCGLHNLLRRRGRLRRLDCLCRAVDGADRAHCLGPVGGVPGCVNSLQPKGVLRPALQAGEGESQPCHGGDPCSVAIQPVPRDANVVGRGTPDERDRRRRLSCECHSMRNGRRLGVGGRARGAQRHWRSGRKRRSREDGARGENGSFQLDQRPLPVAGASNLAKRCE